MSKASIAQLMLLQDKLQPFKTELFLSTINKEFGKKFYNFFEDIDNRAYAAASVAQVHKGLLKSGEEVAIKILRPNIKKILERDIGVLKFVVNILICFSNKLSNLKLIEILNLFKKLVLQETNLLMEAASSDKIRDMLKNDTEVYISKIHWDLCSKKILVMEWIEGIKITEKSKLKSAGHSLKEIASKLAILFLKQAFRDGFFHADIHQGNILITAQGNVALIDFGITSFLDDYNKMFVCEIIYAFMDRDYDRVAQIHFEAGYVPKNQSKQLFSLACRAIGEKIYDRPFAEISVAKLLQQLFETSQNFGMQTQIELLLLQKTMVMVEGIGSILYSKVNMWHLAKPYIGSLVDKKLNHALKIKYKAKNMMKKLDYLQGKSLSHNRINKHLNYSIISATSFIAGIIIAKLLSLF